MLFLERLLLLLALTVQNGQTKLQVADLAIVNLALLLELSIFGANLGKSYGSIRYFGGLLHLLLILLDFLGGVFVRGLKDRKFTLLNSELKEKLSSVPR